MSGEYILVVEDDENIKELLQFNLENAGYDTSCVTSGEKALLNIGTRRPGIIILDPMLPGVDGLAICRQLKEDEATSKIPIIMLTAKGEEEDIIKGLELGADDYITKPFSVKILLARIKAVLRRKNQEETREFIKNEAINIHELVINPKKHMVLAQGEKIELTLTEFKILYYMARHAGWVLTRYQIVEAVRGSDYHVSDRSVDVLVFGLRKKLGEYGRYIETVHGVGYRFKEEYEKK
jgi:two-component system phosphate regulon response regulator PhoB